MSAESTNTEESFNDDKGKAAEVPARAGTREAVPAVVTIGSSASVYCPLCHWPSKKT